MTPTGPCSHCGNPHFLVVPNLATELKRKTGMGYMTQRPYLELTLSICTHCQRAQFFAQNGQEFRVAEGAQLITAPPRG